MGGLWGTISGANAYLALARVRARLIRRKRKDREEKAKGLRQEQESPLGAKAQRPMGRR